MRVLVTGASGMLGHDLCQVFAAAGHDVVATDLAGDGVPMDITDLEAARATMDAYRPDRLVHCAAYTDVDGAERDPNAADRVNVLGSWVVATACAERGTPLCALSTDFVFDGTSAAPYTEWDAANPINSYGRSKWAGEQCVRTVCRTHWIVRTAWLFGTHGRSFPAAILGRAEAADAAARPLRVVADQRGCPTYTRDLARALLDVVRSPFYGTYHITNAGATTWYDLARKTLDLAGLGHVDVMPVTAADWNSPTRRPANSVLRPLALELQGVALPRPWEEALAEFVAERSQRRFATGRADPV